VEISLSPLDETVISSAVNNPFHNYRLRDKPAQAEMGNEENYSRINRSRCDAPCCWSDRSRTADRENLRH
jgi:hypothetical protein